MIPYPVYKLIHFLGIFMLLMTLAATSMHVLRGGSRTDNPIRRATGMTHGIAAFLILLGGFGMLARLGVADAGLPLWISLKLGIWVLLGASLFMAYRGPRFAGPLLVVVPVLAVVAAAIAYYKPL